LEDRIMTRSRFVTCMSVLALSGLGLTGLMASKAAGEKTPDPQKPAGPTKRLVCLGYVDTRDKMVPLYPENYPLPARVTKVLVHEGAEVKEGQPLLEFDIESLKLKVDEADNAIAIARAEQAKAEAMVRAHTVQVNALAKEYQSKEKELKNKKSELDEAERLFKLPSGPAINQLQLEAAKAAYAAAEDNLEAARIKWEGLRAEVPTYLVDLAKENVRKAQNAKLQAEHARDQVRLRAPANGWIIRSFAAEGLIFGMASKEPAFWFVKKGPLFVRAEVSQEWARRVAPGQVAKIEDESDSAQRWTGKVELVPNQFLPKRLGNTGLVDLMPVSDERVLECQVSIDPESGKPAPRFGQKVRVTLGD
jgi:multidrug resistance efflux pump